jgi:DNA-binding IclR family transcriptional regulator
LLDPCLALLAEYQTDTGKASVACKLLAKRLGGSRSTVRRVLEELSRRGSVRVTPERRGPNGSQLVYAFTPTVEALGGEGQVEVRGG